MAISVGFYKYVYKWIIDALSEEIKYRPFESNTNPYKADVFIVGSHPTPLIQHDFRNTQQYANALVNNQEFNELFPDYLKSTSKDTKGAILLSNKLEEQGITSVISYVNALAAQNLTQLKKQRKENQVQYERGLDIFKEVMEEIKPAYLLLHGAYALEQFRQRFEGYFIEYGHTTRTVSELANEGVFGKIVHDDGKETLVMACKSLSVGKERDEVLKNLIKEILKTKSRKNYI